MGGNPEEKSRRKKIIFGIAVRGPSNRSLRGNQEHSWGVAMINQQLGRLWPRVGVFSCNLMTRQNFSEPGGTLVFLLLQCKCCGSATPSVYTVGIAVETYANG